MHGVLMNRGAFLVYDNEGSQLNQLILDHNAGIAGSYEQHTEIVEQIKALWIDSSQLQHFRAGSATLYKKHFDRSSILSTWRALFEEVCHSPEKGRSGETA